MNTKYKVGALSLAIASVAMAYQFNNQPTETSPKNIQANHLADLQNTGESLQNSSTTANHVTDKSQLTNKNQVNKNHVTENNSLLINNESVNKPLQLQARQVGYNHSLVFDTDARNRKITVGEKQHTDKNGNPITDAIFRDGFGREALFRGWNVSGAHKLKSMNFMPFKNTYDAAQSFGVMGKQMGANQIRFTISWEGVHTGPDEIDYNYLQQIVAQMREAIKRRMYIVVDYHSDLYTRHTFTKDSAHTGNGAPKWIVEPGNHGKDACGLPCLFSWGGHKLFDPATKSAYRAFWLDSAIETNKGTRNVQTEFVWQLGKVAKYLNENLTDAEKDYVLGIEPLNEPFDAGIKELGLKDFGEFDNKILWPFYQRVRTAMDENGFSNKYVYAEPNVFWYTTTGIVAPSSGYGYLKYAPGKKFVFSPHMYDQGRMGVGEIRLADNATYMHKLDEVRKEARRLGTPIFLGEYGMWNSGKGKQDNLRIINGTIQAMQTSNGQETIATDNVLEDKQRVETNKASRFADFYTPFISGTQWHWNHYYGKSIEYQNDNPDKIITKFDAWNNEDFSVVKEYSTQYLHGAAINERAYPRRTQGDLMHFAYNAKVKDKFGNSLDWHSIRVDLANEFENKEYFRDRKFAIAVWRGRKANAPTELYIPRSFKPSYTTVITEKNIQKGLALTNTTKNTANEILLTQDADQWSGSGNRLFIWDDADRNETQDSMHYALVVEHAEDMNAQQLATLQKALTQRIVKEQKSAVYLPTKMTFSGYKADAGANTHFQLIEQRHNLCLDVAYGYAIDGQRVQTFACNNTNAQRWQYNALTGKIHSKLNANKCLTVKGNVQQGSILELQTCRTDLNAKQQFNKGKGWTFVLTANPSLIIESFGKFAGNVGLGNATGNNNQKWLVRY